MIFVKLYWTNFLSLHAIMELTSDKFKVSVIGYGSWASTLVGILSSKGIKVNWLVTNNEVAESLLAEGRNCKYVSELQFNMEDICISDDVNAVIDAGDIVLLACPSAFLDSILKPYTGSFEGKYVISAIKGIIPLKYTTVLEYIHDRSGLPFSQMGVISGPSHAEEVSRGKLSFITAAASTEEMGSMIADMFSTPYLRVSTSTDIYGIEYAALMKNIYAIAAGMAAGLGYGDNFLSVLIASCAEEMTRFINESYPFERNTFGRAYLGDLLVTCNSNYSRNRRLGQLIGKGCTVKSAINEMTMVAEGYYAAECIHEINKKYGISIPVADMVYRVLYEGARARLSVAELTKSL